MLQDRPELTRINKEQSDVVDPTNMVGQLSLKDSTTGDATKKGENYQCKVFAEKRQRELRIYSVCQFPMEKVLIYVEL